MRPQMREVVRPWMPVVFRPAGRVGRGGVLLRTRPLRIAVRAGRAWREQSKEHPEWYNSQLTRGFRMLVEHGNIVIPYGKTSFRKTVGTRRIKDFAKYVEKYAARGRDFAKFPFNVGVNAIVELTGKAGNPTHIVVIKRGERVFEAPGFLDYPAGILQYKQNPIERIKNRIVAELGVNQEQIKFIGKEFKPHEGRNPPALAVDLDKTRANYNIVYVVRLDLTKEEVEAKFRKTGDKYAAGEIRFIERNPEAIRKELRGIGRKMVLPETLKIYADELEKIKRG